MSMFGNYTSGIAGTCLDCTDRYPGCHDAYEKYQGAKKEWNERRDRIREEKEKSKLFAEYKVTKIIRERKQ